MFTAVPSLGHLFGMTGARLVTTMLNALQSLDEHTGLLTTSPAGGQDMAIAPERMS